ncbi:MAG: glycosyltransferase involved in cell wall bisynthesis [Chloroflexi bacterium]|jgi:glycosyltransferase involved in cell wall biosynthesis|nr:glycosyltransferase involved in cell wall bisynthesis [Chloroflexota bacterium]
MRHLACVPLRIGYVSKLPPSSSGVARYAEDFMKALAIVGELAWVLPLRVAAPESQRLRTILRVVVTTVHKVRSKKLDVVHIELSGRALAEFYAALAIMFCCPDVRLWLTIHDAPHVTGGVGYISLLDRRVLRRLAHLFSVSAGRVLERYLLNRADRVFCLSSYGATATERFFGLRRSIDALPFVTSLPPLSDKSSDSVTIFCPGHVGSDEMVLPVFPAVVDLPAHCKVTVEIGHCDRATRKSLQKIAEEMGLSDRVVFLGYLTQQRELDQAFERAAIVVRHRPPGETNLGNWAAVSGPIISAMAQGCAVISSDSRGVREYLQHGITALDLADDPAEVSGAVAKLLSSASVRNSMGTHARAYIASHNTPEIVAAWILALNGNIDGRLTRE